MNGPTRRRLKSNVMVVVLASTVVVAVVPLVFILGTLIVKGAGSLNAMFFIASPVPAGQTGGGVGHAVIGTLVIVGMACLMGLPLGIGAGIYTAEYPNTKLAATCRFVADVMNGTPSIVVGVFAWAWIVARQGHFSAYAGSVALAILMIPMVMRTTEEMIKLVPHSLREAALALGYPRWRATLTVVLRTALPGIVTGTLLAVARVAGETAPAPLHGPGKPVLLARRLPANGRASTCGVHLCHRPVPGMAPPGLGHGVGTDHRGAGAEPGCAPGHPATVPA